MTLFTSYLLNRPVLDDHGTLAGKLHDFNVEQRGDLMVVTSMVLRRGRRRYAIVPIGDVRPAERLSLTRPASSYLDTRLPDDALYLARDILDAQVVDTSGAKVIRVNDIQLDWLPIGLVVSGVDIGFWGICRRLGLAPVLKWAVDSFGLKVPEGLVPWNHIAPVSGEMQGLRLQVAQDNLKGMHPADLAEIIADLGHAERLQLLETLPIEQMADVVEESEPALQVAILRDLGDKIAADILDEMDPDDAADLLEELPEHESERLMDLMEPEGAEVVRELMAWPENSAGSLMTPRYLGLPGSATVGEALGRLRGGLPLREEVLYLYVVEDEILKGLVSLRRLLAGHDQDPLSVHAVPVTYHLPPTAPQHEVLELMARYNILAVPIVDDSEQMLGVVTIYDVFDLLVDLAAR